MRPRLAASASLASLLSLASLASLAACATDSSASCTADTQCAAGERCVAGACVHGGGDGATGDASLDGRADAQPTNDVPGDHPLMGTGCSGDLRTVLAYDGTPLGTCPDDQGCLNGACVPACDAAAASQGSRGCDFFASTPPVWPQVLQPCHAIFVTNTWSRAVHLTVSRHGASLDVTQFGRIVDNAADPSAWQPVPSTGVPSGAVAVLFLSSNPMSVMSETGHPLTCPVAPAVNAATIASGSNLGDAFHVVADAPVSAYSIMPFGGARSYVPGATMLLPVSAWNTSYVTMNPPAGTAMPGGPQWFQVVAQADNTVVRVRPTADLPAGTMVPAVTHGTEGTITLNAGQFVHWELPAGNGDPSASVVVADHPVAVSTGNRFLRLQPTPGPGGESTHTQMLPLSALGNAYAAAPYPTRRADLMPEAVPYRLVGAVDGTTLTFDPPVAGAPATLSRGAVVDFTASVAFQVHSQDAMHPFAAAQLMPTANIGVPNRPGVTYNEIAGITPRLGDEEFTQLFPPAQFLSDYVFFTDPTYGTTSLVVVRERGADGFAPVMVDCLGAVSGFAPLGTDGHYEWATVDLVRAGMGNGTCTNGRHTASSTANFGVTVWGVDTYASYAYPAGGNARQLTMIQPPG